jgi:hypothetical protein
MKKKNKKKMKKYEKNGKKRKKKRLMRPLYIEPVTSLGKCRVTFYWMT